MFPFRLKQNGNLFDGNSYVLSEVLLTQKSTGSNNPHQVCPVGGNIEDGESAIDTIHRELLEETSYSALDITNTCPVLQSYTFRHGKTKRISAERNVLFFAGSVNVPLQNAVADDEAHHVIACSLPDVQAMIRGETVSILHQPSVMLDSLSLSRTARKKAGTTAKNREIQQILTFCTQSFAAIEASTKVEFLRFLLNEYWAKKEALMHCRHFDEENESINGLFACDARKVEVEFRGFLQRHNIPVKEVLCAFEEFAKRS